MAYPISIHVVHDQARDLIALKAALKSVECDVVTASSGRAALQCVLAQDFAVMVLVLRSKATAFLELFREALVREERTAELNRVAADELQDVNGRIVSAAMKAHEHADAQTELRNVAETVLNARDEFVSTTSRELRTPVISIQTDAQLAMHALVDATSDRERVALGYLRNILGSADSALLLTNSLTDGSDTRGDTARSR